jgi:hypothetical protein
MGTRQHGTWRVRLYAPVRCAVMVQGSTVYVRPLACSLAAVARLLLSSTVLSVLLDTRQDNRTDWRKERLERVIRPSCLDCVSYRGVRSFEPILILLPYHPSPRFLGHQQQAAAIVIHSIAHVARLRRRMSIVVTSTAMKL